MQGTRGRVAIPTPDPPSLDRWPVRLSESGRRLISVGSDRRLRPTECNQILKMFLAYISPSRLPRFPALDLGYTLGQVNQVPS